jgi:hypothetical protein
MWRMLQQSTGSDFVIATGESRWSPTYRMSDVVKAMVAAERVEAERL